MYKYAQVDQLAAKAAAALVLWLRLNLKGLPSKCKPSFCWISEHLSILWNIIKPLESFAFKFHEMERYVKLLDFIKNIVKEKSQIIC